jgi:hypothetical protein
MGPFNWIDIDGIRYSWDGQDNIVCSGRFAYQTQLDGSSLTGLEIENEDGEAAGVLNVDFAAMQLSFVPYVGVESPHMVLLCGDGQSQQECSLQSITAPLHDLLASPLVRDTFCRGTHSTSMRPTGCRNWPPHRISLNRQHRRSTRSASAWT